MDTPGIRAGQTYRDLDKHALNRTIRIDRLSHTNAEATILTDGRGPNRVGRKTSVPIAKLRTSWELLAESPEWETVLLDGRHEWWGIRHAATGQLIARWDGTPARWTTRALADEDVAALGRGENATRSLDILATTPEGAGHFWACPKPSNNPGHDVPHSEPGDCRLHEIPLSEYDANGHEVNP
jgi:hypothetical protein